MKTKKPKFVAGVFVTALIVCIVDSYIYQNAPIDDKFIAGSTAGKNGVWFRNYWYRGKYTEPDFEKMLERVKSHHLRYAYFHVLSVAKDGRLEYHHPKEAKKLTDKMHESCPNTLCLAWVFIPSDFLSNGVDLGQAATKTNLHQEAKWLIDECGFDGVQWDYEFAPNNDKRFLTFLAESRKAIPTSKHLSIAAPMNYPLTLYGWSDDYFKEVAPFVDQVAVMSYDSYLWLPRMYGALVARQVKHVSQDVSQANPHCTVIIGLPTYKNTTLTHQPFCESLANSLRGIEQGLRDNKKSAEKSNIDGIALFADYTTDEKDWKLFDSTIKSDLNN